MHKTHIFDQKNNAKKKYFTDLPTLIFSDHYRKQTIFFSWPKANLYECYLLLKINLYISEHEPLNNLMEESRLSCNFPLKYFPKISFVKKINGPFSATAGIYGLKLNQPEPA